MLVQGDVASRHVLQQSQMLVQLCTHYMCISLEVPKRGKRTLQKPAVPASTEQNTCSHVMVPLWPHYYSSIIIQQWVCSCQPVAALQWIAVCSNVRHGGLIECMA